jgi:catechol 2,3-dioxygenase-like lactoylglutathione lyase family enzyme
MEKPHIRFQRANYVVSNLERALEFYVGVLGLTLEYVQEAEKTSYSYPVFEIPNEANIRFVVLSAPNQPRVMALTEITNLKIEPVPHPRRAAIVLEVPDVYSMANRAKEAGFFVCEPVEFETNDGRKGLELGMTDADDNLTVIYKIYD